MRVRLQKGKQRELIELVKRKLNLSWKELGKKVGIAYSYLRGDLRYERVLLPKEVYHRLCRIAGVNFNRFVLQELDENWGQRKGGKRSRPRPKPPKLLVKEPSKELAEIIGIMLGDGSIYVNSLHKVYQVTISGHSEDDKEYLLNHVKPLLERVFRRKFYVKFHKKGKEIFLINQEKDVVFTLQSYGFPAGNKVVNNVGIPDWIFNSKKFLKSCIRGLIDTDGSVCPITGRKYPYIWFKTRVPNLRRTFSRAMKILGFKLSKWSKRSTSQTYIGKKSLVLKYFREIRFNNPKHIKRFEKSWKAPVV